MTNALILAKVDAARLALMEAKDAISAKKVVDMAKAAEVYATRQKSEEAKEYAHSIWIDALRLEGDFLAANPKATGAMGIGSALPAGKRTTPPTFAQQGITQKEASLAQFVSRVAEEQPDKIEQVRKGEVTLTEVRRQMNRQEAVQKVQDFPSDKYRVIYADPPWKYGDSREGLEGTTGATAHYPTLSIAELCALPVAALADDNSVLFLWVTSPLLFDADKIITAWGFDYKASFVWDKVKHNMGHYNSVRHEFLLICTKGSCLPDIPKLYDSVQSVERSDKHSEKPEEFRAIIDALYPNGKRIELFARTESKGWDKWGSQ